MVSVIIGKMNDGQKQRLIEADESEIKVVSEAHGNLFCALILLPKGKRMSEIVARTLIEFDNEDDALKEGESVVDQIRGIDPIVEEELEENTDPASDPKPSPDPKDPETLEADPDEPKTDGTEGSDSVDATLFPDGDSND